MSHAFFQDTAIPANASITFIDRAGTVKTIELFWRGTPTQYKDGEGANAPAMTDETVEVFGVDPGDTNIVHIFNGMMIPTLAFWSKYPREFDGRPMVGRYIRMNLIDGVTTETTVSNLIRQKHHNFMYTRDKRHYQYEDPISKEADTTGDTPHTPIIWDLLKSYTPIKMEAAEKPAHVKLIDRKITRFDRQRTSNNIVFYVEHHIKHAMGHIMKYKSNGTGILPVAYVARHKELEVGQKLHARLFQRNPLMQTLTILNDHSACSSIMCINALDM